MGAAILGGLGAAAPFTPLWLISLVTLAMSTGLVVCGLIILWRGGLVPFGQALFFATGAYTVALSGRWFGVTDAFLLIALAVIMAALVAFVVGFLLAQYREIFFAMLSLALSMILYGVLVKSETLNLTPGQRGTVALPNGDFAVLFAGISADKARRVRHRVEMPGMNATVRAIAPGGRTLDVLQLGEKLVIVATTVGR